MPRPIFPTRATPAPYMGQPALPVITTCNSALYDPDLPRGYLSPSAVGAYLSCAYSWYLQYVEKTEQLTSAPLVVGKVIHEILQENAIQKVKTTHNLSAKDLIGKWDAKWATAHPTVDNWTEDETAESVALQGRQLLNMYASSPLSGLTARSTEDIEKPFRVLIGGVPVVGSIDIIVVAADTPTIVDYKVSKTAHSEVEAAASLQLGAYAIAEGTNSVAYISIVKTKLPKVVYAEALRTPRSLAKVAGVFTTVSAAIKKGAFPYTDPAGWKCSAKFCGVWHACPQGGKY